MSRAALSEIYIQQVYWLVLGGILGSVVAVIDYRHYERLGYLTEAQSLCSSGLGACSSPADALSMEARVHCAGCPLTV